MKTITINRRKINVSAADERIIRRLAETGYATRLSDFETGRGRYKNNSARQNNSSASWQDCGWRIFTRTTTNPAARRFFAANPRNEFCVAGDPKRINLIIKKLEEMK